MLLYSFIYTYIHAIFSTIFNGPICLMLGVLLWLIISNQGVGFYLFAGLFYISTRGVWSNRKLIYDQMDSIIHVLE